MDITFDDIKKLKEHLDNLPLQTWEPLNYKMSSTEEYNKLYIKFFGPCVITDIPKSMIAGGIQYISP